MKALILDYSTDRSETSAIKHWLPKGIDIRSLFIDTESSFPDELINEDFSYVIHTGSALSITEPAPFTNKAIRYIQRVREKGIAQMGICYGHQLLCLSLVGAHAVRRSPKGLEAGWSSVTFIEDAMRYLEVRETENVWQFHFDEVTELPDGSELLATNSHTEIQAFINQKQRLFGTQFHPEFDREMGNTIYLKYRELLVKHQYNPDEMILQSPSLNAGKVFFGFFLNRFD